MSGDEKYFVHVDMDAFFASVEQRDDPSIKGLPVVVGADPKGGKGRGVVAACSYEARKFGIHSAMPITTAYRKCPHAVYLTPHHNKYSEESKKIFKILENFTPDVEPISIDEAFLDITSSYHLFGTPRETCLKIKASIKDETDLNASIGMAPNKMTAKIASDLDKPNGLVIVGQKDLLDFLHRLPVEKLWGVGTKTKEAFKEIGIKTIGDLARKKKKNFIQKFGKAGEHVWNLANGIDPRDVQTEREIKSVGHEHTFDLDVNDKKVLLDMLMYLSEKVSRRLRKYGLKGKTITLKLRFSDFSTFTKAVTMEEPTNFVEDIFRYAAQKFKTFDIQKKTVRLIGVQVSGFLDTTRQFSLFESDDQNQKKKERLHLAVDQIKDKFGEKAIKHRSGKYKKKE